MVDELLSRNREWAASQCRENPHYFQDFTKGQQPEFFWIGCSDSRVPANVIAQQGPGEVFVHRNIANVVHSSDLNLLSALEFAVNSLGIRKVLVCGHYGCGGVRASMESQDHGLADHWLEPIRRLEIKHREELALLKDDEARQNRLAELNVIEGVIRLSETPILRNAWERGIPIRVHGLVYNLGDGLLRDLECTATQPLLSGLR